MQIKNKFLNDLAKTATGAVGGLQAIKDELDVIIKSHLEKHLASLDTISREEFNIVKDMASKARLENEELKQQIYELKKRIK